MNYIFNNIDSVKESINNICTKNSINSDSINLVAVSKTFDCNSIENAYSAGIRDFGENKVQEFTEKYNYFKDKHTDIRWHLIGHLQTNKVKSVIGKTALIHSVDTFHLAQEINNQSNNLNLCTNILIQVNTSNESTKFGVEVEKCIELVKECSTFNNIVINGLMTIGEHSSDKENIKNNFRKAKELYDEIALLNLDNVKLKYLSMGMSSDYDLAITEGSNMLRLGTIIFGNRNYTIPELKVP